MGRGSRWPGLPAILCLFHSQTYQVLGQSKVTAAMLQMLRHLLLVNLMSFQLSILVPNFLVPQGLVLISQFPKLLISTSLTLLVVVSVLLAFIAQAE